MVVGIQKVAQPLLVFCTVNTSGLERKLRTSLSIGIAKIKLLKASWRLMELKRTLKLM
jgi:hypothetical protein